MSEHDRDIATAIHHEIISPGRVGAALATWQQNRHIDERKRMWIVLANASALSIDAVLARRQREAARTGPWESPVADTRWRHPVTGDTWIIDGRTGRAKAIVPARRVGEREERERCARHLEARAIRLRDHGPTTAEGVLTATAGAQVGALIDAAADVRAGQWGDYEEEDGYPGSLLPRKRGVP